MCVMEDVVKAVEAAGIRDQVKIMVGGAPVTEAFCRQIGADVYTADAASAPHRFYRGWRYRRRSRSECCRPCRSQYPDTDDLQSAAISGLTLGTDAVEVYRAIVFGAVCGLRRIVSGFLDAGIQIDDLIAVGGISQKSAYIMQLIADMLGKKLSILDADQTCAIGAAMYAAVAAGIYAGAPEAGAHMAARVIETFDPNEARREAYEAPYQAYLRLAAFQEHASSHQGCGTSAEKKDSL